MPLQQLPDRLDDATHRQLDEAVNADAASLEFPEVLPPALHALLLRLITVCSNGDMNPGYKSLTRTEVKALVRTHEELCDMLSSAWEEKSYRKIRNLAILKKHPATSIVEAEILGTFKNQRDLRDILSSSFRETYRGAAVEGFYEYLTQNEKLFRTVHRKRFYAKICSVVQSSGTGKSRMMTELWTKGVVVIYMNLRAEQDNLSFPAQDFIPSNILTQFPETEGSYRFTCYTFFTALFETIFGYLLTNEATRKSKEDVMSWVAKMCDMSDPPMDDTRARFFEKFFDRYKELYHDHMYGKVTPKEPSRAAAHNEKTDDDGAGTDVNEDANKLGKPAVSSSSSGPPDFTSPLRTAHSKMAQCLERVFADNNSDLPKLLIALDETHSLTPVHAEGGYRPADVLCEAINKYCYDENHAVWVVLVSSSSKVADFSPPEKNCFSRGGQRLFLPYTQLGWDQSALGLGQIHVENVAQLSHIIGYGRPLWQSLRTALKLPESVLKLASSMLCGGDFFDATKPHHVLAVLGQRFGLNVTLGHPDSVGHLENAVASHLHVCLSMTLDRNWRSTTYPSEPLLSCAAANTLHCVEGQLDAALATLLRVINSGMIDMGQRGELASRLLWLLAKDLFIRTEQKDAITKMPSSWDDHLIDCEMIPVVGWLEFIFGSRIWDEASLARKTFQNAYLNFSHWVCMKVNIAGSNGRNTIGLEEWTLRHWQRTSAVQCSHQQPLIDKAIPIYFRGGPDDAPAQSRMSHIFISDKARKSVSSRAELAEITRRDRTIGGDDEASSPLPYIAILADLGQPSNCSVTFPEREAKDRCLRIYAAGVDTTTYPFLAKYPALMKFLQDFVHLQQIPEKESLFREYLHGQATFGSTPAAENMVGRRFR